MQVYPVRAGYTVRFVLVLLVTLAASGCKQSAIEEEIEKAGLKGQSIQAYACPAVPTPITIDPAIGVDTPAVYVCERHEIKWNNPKKHKFTIHFEESPFKDGNTDFDDQSTEPMEVKHFAAIKCFKYTITVNGGKPFDPHVIAGGGYLLNN